MLSKTIQKFLDANKIKYEVIEHKTVYTAFDKASTLHAKTQEVGKTVVVSLDGKDYALGLIPSNKNLDKKKVLSTFNKLRAKAKEKNYKKIDFAKEQWMKNNFKGVKMGATPPFGALYKLPFFMDNAMAKPSKIIVNGGEYELSIKLSPASLIKINSDTIKGGFSMAKK
ncbi:MAG: YbaK/EbsC family protein [Candidatus Portnoybacteria bacterium]|nr:YbaK/EbsC family protein [Candidatus Portnoybacteria bacterium]MDD4983113.1 YbaK/EbsC family protein [Candidatus Portnoybacteria bacterium]